MQKNHSSNVRRAIGLVTLAALAACGHEVTDPRALLGDVRHMSAVPAMPAPVVGHVFESATPPAAPAGESARTSLSPLPAERPCIAFVGSRVAGTIDAEVQRAFAATRPTRRTELLPATDREVVDHLMLGRGDFGLLGGALSQREVHAGLRQQPLGVELFAVTVAPTCPVRSLTHMQVRQIFTGALTDWSQLGEAPQPIVAVVPAEQALAERAERTLIPGDSFAPGCVRAADERHVVDQLLQHRGAIGVIRITAGQREGGQKLLQIDWTPPTPEAFAYGTYPYGMPLQLVTSGAPGENARRFAEFAASPEGRALLGRTLAFTP